MLGAPKFDRNHDVNNDVAGVVTGLAWTSVGGDILFIESILSKGKGRLTVTGNLGKFMKESATIAMEYLKSNAEQYDLDPQIFQKVECSYSRSRGSNTKRWAFCWYHNIYSSCICFHK